MININLLKSKIVLKGYNISSFCKEIKMKPQVFYNKINGNSYFNSKEIKIISDVLDLNVVDKNFIFFCD
ncbi:hypothetical protein [Streptobacillus moniliformis]|uniref:hypothetical protein n=1 Tax=Streptobacillus moniliformis TaxID=34105 RepID=UPI0007E3BAEF|nr:hypothetical protein [Streptobacillus moniliformis]